MSLYPRTHWRRSGRYPCQLAFSLRVSTYRGQYGTERWASQSKILAFTSFIHWQTPKKLLLCTRMLETQQGVRQMTLSLIEPVFPCIFQPNNQEDWWLIKYKLLKTIPGSAGPTGSSSFLSLRSHHVPHAHLIVFQPPWLPVFLRHIKLIIFSRLWLLFPSTQNVLPSDPHKTVFSTWKSPS